MTWPTFQLVWPILLVLVYLLAMSMVRVLSAKLYYAVALHNRICAARNMRRQFFEHGSILDINVDPEAVE